MQVNNFRKDLRKAENSIVGIAAAIDAYESGLIIFDECLQLIAEEYHKDGIKAANICSSCKYFSVCGDLDRTTPCKGKAANV